jgi:AcrR family transcriptional regulator
VVELHLGDSGWIGLSLVMPVFSLESCGFKINLTRNIWRCDAIFHHNLTACPIDSQQNAQYNLLMTDRPSVCRRMGRAMVRVVKDYAVRRNEILDVALLLITTKGYEQMTIQDILDSLGISKGAFYHYFNSKGALLEALIERMEQEAEEWLAPLVRDPDLPALEKFRRFFDTAAQWKTARKSYILSLMRTWYADENALVRQKVQSAQIKRISPLLSEIIYQGIREKVFNTPYPDQAGEIILSFMQGLGENFIPWILADEPGSGISQSLQDTIAAYNYALERLLGAPPGSLPIMDAETLEEWVSPSTSLA